MRLLVLLLLLVTAPLDAATVTGLAATGTGVTVALDGEVGTVKTFALADPLRLVVDLAGVAAARRVAEGDAAVSRARIGQFDPETARLVIELARPMRLAGAVAGDGGLALTLAPVAQAGFDRDVGRGRHPVAVAGAAPVPAPADFDLPPDTLAVPPEATTEAAPPAAEKVPPVPRSRRPLVVLDAGHGGKDVGTISVVDGAYEKNVTLAIARVTAAALNRRGRVRVVLTRAGDVFVPLPQRVAIALAARADLFVSIHADSAPNPDAHGASVYTLSETASDAVAARLAARENKSDIIAGVNLGIDAPEVGDILIDLVQRETMNVAITFAETLQASLGDQLGWRGEFHQFAGFRVLKAADVPSVLLETGYLSNTGDARLLLSAAGQKRIGEGIARAVEAHFATRRGRG